MAEPERGSSPSCDLCATVLAVVFCRNEQRVFCSGCDLRVHANAADHARYSLESKQAQLPLNEAGPPVRDAPALHSRPFPVDSFLQFGSPPGFVLAPPQPVSALTSAPPPPLATSLGSEGEWLAAAALQPTGFDASGVEASLMVGSYGSLGRRSILLTGSPGTALCWASRAHDLRRLQLPHHWRNVSGEASAPVGAAGGPSCAPDAPSMLPPVTEALPSARPPPPGRAKTGAPSRPADSDSEMDGGGGGGYGAESDGEAQAGIFCADEEEEEGGEAEARMDAGWHVPPRPLPSAAAAAAAAKHSRPALAAHHAPSTVDEEADGEPDGDGKDSDDDDTAFDIEEGLRFGQLVLQPRATPVRRPGGVMLGVSAPSGGRGEGSSGSAAMAGQAAPRRATSGGGGSPGGGGGGAAGGGGGEASGAGTARGYPADASTLGRRCVHCGNQKTPQWRAGPAGAKTLCNACGVRFKNGRLVPRVIYPPMMYGGEDEDDDYEEDEPEVGARGGGRVPHLSAKRIAEAAAYGASPPFVPLRHSMGGGAVPPPSAPHIPKRARGSAAQVPPVLRT